MDANLKTSLPVLDDSCCCPLLGPGEICQSLEELLLGILVRDRAAAIPVAPNVTAEIFDDSRNRRLFMALRDGYWQSLPVEERLYASRCAEKLRALEKRSHRLAAEELIRTLAEQRMTMLEAHCPDSFSLSAAGMPSKQSSGGVQKRA